MRITFVLPQFDRGGGVRVVAIHAEQLRKRGHEVNVVGAKVERPTFRETLRSLVRQFRWPEGETDDTTHFENTGVTPTILNHHGPIIDADIPDADIVIATWWETAEWVAKLDNCKGAKAHFVQGYETFGGPEDRVDAAYRLPLAKIVIAEWLAELLRRKFDQEPVRVVMNSVDTERFFAPERSKPATPTVGLIYSVFSIKGCDISIRAFELARRKLPDLQLVSCSAQQVDEKNLPLPTGTEFVFQAKDPDLRRIYSKCDAWLFGTRMEGFGLPILEAMACRTPVIGTPAGAAPELIGQGGGVLVPPEDPQAMADAIIRLCSMPDDEWRQMSDIAYKTAHGYCWEDASSAFEQALGEIAETH